MKRIIHAWNKASLVKRILIGMLCGGILGLTLPNLSGIGLLRGFIRWRSKSCCSYPSLCSRC